MIKYQLGRARPLSSLCCLQTFPSMRWYEESQQFPVEIRLWLIYCYFWKSVCDSVCALLCLFFLILFYFCSSSALLYIWIVSLLFLQFAPLIQTFRPTLYLSVYCLVDNKILLGLLEKRILPAAVSDGDNKTTAEGLDWDVTRTAQTWA